MDSIKPLLTEHSRLFHKADLLELRLCRLLNGFGFNPKTRQLFRLVSRLGDGVFWYVLGALLPLTLGMEGFAALGHITIMGLICVGLYRQLKRKLVRQRPFMSFSAIQAYTRPLDLYSFPSGHTMNAVNFAILFGYFFPPLAWILTPFAVLIALSRVILGMHYPTDVMVGAVLGAALAWGSLLLWPAGMFASSLL